MPFVQTEVALRCRQHVPKDAELILQFLFPLACRFQFLFYRLAIIVGRAHSFNLGFQIGR